jgi:hypothetical protein
MREFGNHRTHKVNDIQLKTDIIGKGKAISVTGHEGQ